jgi:hypothetical protein
LLQATAEVNRIFKSTPDEAAAAAHKNMRPVPLALGMAWLNTVLLVVLPCLVASLAFGGGAMVRALGLELVTSDGEPASRGRVAWRNLLAWLPMLVAPLAAWVLAGAAGWSVAALGAALGLAVLAVVSCVALDRSVQDRLAGTFVVPR